MSEAATALADARAMKLTRICFDYKEMLA
jgi:hypothetical protein